jgi:hypothetical protein
VAVHRCFDFMPFSAEHIGNQLPQPRIIFHVEHSDAAFSGVHGVHGVHGLDALVAELVV